MLADRMGICRRMPGVRKVSVLASFRLRMDERFGTSRTSSKVKPGSDLSFMDELLIILQTN
jgi:hypothetical protein